MNRIFLKYYLSFLIGFFLILYFNIVNNGSPDHVGINILKCLAGAVVGSAVLGTLYYKLDTQWGPSKREKTFIRPPFTELFQNGFKRQGEVVIGQVHNYPVIFFYTWQPVKSMIKLYIAFEMGSSFHVYANEDVLRDIVNRNQPANRFSSEAFVWTDNTIGCTFEYYFKPPTYKKLMAKVDELTGILVREGLTPMSSGKQIRLH